jgi:hypothetical protein
MKQLGKSVHNDDMDVQTLGVISKSAEVRWSFTHHLRPDTAWCVPPRRRSA